MFERQKEGGLVMLLGLAFTLWCLWSLAKNAMMRRESEVCADDFWSSIRMAGYGFGHIFVPMF
ncbi:MAG: hypothetical protein V1907_01545 [Candidatus Kerfeldbacteria bacterium]